MRIRAQVLLVAVALLIPALPALTQTANPLVGTWERLSLRNPDGSVGQPPAAAAFLIFSAEGYYSQTTISGNRLTRHFDSVSDPNQEGNQAVQEFRIDGDVLVLTGTSPGSQQEARFRRVK